MMSGDSLIAKPRLFQVDEGGAIPTSPHQLEIRKVSAKSACGLNEEWHSRLPKIDWSNVVRNVHYICFIAYYQNTPFGVGIWSTPVAGNRFKDGEKLLELRRLAISPNAPKNSATRMISVMTRLIRKELPDIIKLISYQDTEVHKGTIYKASNWVVGGESAGISWTNKNRERNKEQTLAKKVRWEYTLKREGGLK